MLLVLILLLEDLDDDDVEMLELDVEMLELDVEMLEVEMLELDVEMLDAELPLASPKSHPGSEFPPLSVFVPSVASISNVTNDTSEFVTLQYDASAVTESSSVKLRLLI